MSTTDTTPAATPPQVMTQPPEESAEPDYFGFGTTKDVYLPGSKTQYVTVKAMNEGEKKRYQNLTNRDVTITAQRETKMRLQAGDERHVLIESGIVGWNVLRRNDKGVLAPVPFTKAEVGRFLTDADPKIIEGIEKEIRKLNPWTLGDATVEDMEREIANLQEMLEAKRKEEAGNADS